MTVSDVLRSTLVMVTVAPGIALPLESTMTPATLPYTACAFADDGLHASAQAMSRTDIRTSERFGGVVERKAIGSFIRRSSRSQETAAKLSRMVMTPFSRVKSECVQVHRETVSRRNQ